MIEEIKTYLLKELNLVLQPHKIYLQHYTKGVTFLGAILKPHRSYIGARVKGNFYQAIKDQNELIKSRIPSTSEVTSFVAIMNAYLGIMKHHKTYNLRKKMITKNISETWLNYIYITASFNKFVVRKGTKRSTV